MRIRLETDAYFLIIQAIQNGTYSLVVSPVHYQEIEAIKDVQERHELLSLLRKLGTNAECDLEQTRRKAEDLHAQGLGVADAAHVAFALAAADCFVSCDDRLLRKCKRLAAEVNAKTPVEFCIDEDLK
jgi:predicted nucleic acid-binding protein